jgi:hypothetical protein
VSSEMQPGPRTERVCVGECFFLPSRRSLVLDLVFAQMNATPMTASADEQVSPRRHVPQQRRRGGREPARGRGVAGIGEALRAVAEEAAVEVDAPRVGGQAVGQLHPARGVAELAVGGGDVREALAQPVHGVLAGARRRGAEPGARHVLVDQLQRVHEAHVKGLRVGRRRGPAHRGQDRRVASCAGDEEEENGWEDGVAARYACWSPPPMHGRVVLAALHARANVPLPTSFLYTCAWRARCARCASL